MIRSYTIFCDTWRGGEIEYSFRHLRDAEKKFDEIRDVPFKVLLATDDKLGDITVKKESA